ncbi:MAG: UbiX family flavin prenyltransferase [Turneriella sp.]|nr:UbiX family flavin prenyltransferase [Turneriella sp.]
MSRRLIIGVTGASGAEYALRFLWRLSSLAGESDLIFSPNFFKVLSAEAGIEANTATLETIFNLIQERYGAPEKKHHFSLCDYRDIGSRAASGSARYDAMAVIPCSMKTAAAIAHGLSSNLIERAADVSLKEKRPLVLCPRETPLSSIHLKNLLTLSEAGATVMPLMPGYYHRPQQLSDLYDFMTDRVLTHLGFTERFIKPWQP